MTEAQTLQCVAAGDSEALVELIERYSAYVQTIARNITIPPLQQEDVEEIAADVFVSLWKNASGVEDGKLKAWLAAVTRNCAKNKLRSLNLSVPLEDEFMVITAPDADEELLAQEIQQLTLEAVNQLDEPDRSIFKRYYFLYQKTEDIAQAMELSTSAVKTRLFRGREKLRKNLTERGYSCEVYNC
jgi:RNA polymerase sigma-70 factor (ECF subfamily)